MTIREALYIQSSGYNTNSKYSLKDYLEACKIVRSNKKEVENERAKLSEKVDNLFRV